VREELAKQGARFAAIEEALARPGWRSDVDYSDAVAYLGSPNELPLALIHACHALQDRALLAAREGRLEESHGDLRRLLRLSDRASEEPTVISLLVRVTGGQAVLTGLRHVLSREAPSGHARWALSADGWARFDAEIDDPQWHAFTSPDRLVRMGPGSHRGTIDPLSGKPYLSARNDDGTTRWWGVGPDGKDDGGKDGRESGLETGDIVWTAPQVR
jgi:hypothetical protein